MITDKLQNYVDTNYENISKYKLLEDLIFYGIFIYYYYFGPINDSIQNFKIFKYIILIFILRYTFNYLTQKKEDNEIKYEINSKLAIFSIIILFLTKNESFITTLLILFSFALMSTIFKSGYTVDNILTVYIILTMYYLKIIE